MIIWTRRLYISCELSIFAVNKNVNIPHTMKFNVSSKALYNCTSAVSKIINAKNTMTILDNFLIELSGDTLTVKACDGENFLVGRLAVTEAEGDGVVCLDARRLVELLKELPEVGIEMKVDPEANYATSITYANGEFNFMGFSGEEYPEPDSISENDSDFTPLKFTAEASQLIRGVDKTIFAAGNDELRPQMSGIFWDMKEDSLVFVSTDTRKLMKFTDRGIKPGATGSFILPMKSAIVMRSVFSKETTVNIDVKSKGVTFESDNYTFNSRFVKGRFPDYERVIPKANPYTMTIDHQTFQSSVRRIIAFRKTENSLIRFRIQPTQVILKSSDDSYNASAWESAPCDFTGNDLVIGFSGIYINEILSTIASRDVVIKLSDPSRPGVFEPMENEDDTELIALLMPMLVTEF